MIGREPTCRHDTRHVRVADQGLSPRVENAQHADLGAEVTRVGGDLTQRGGTRLKEPCVEAGALPISQGQQPVWQRADDVYIRHVEQVPRARVEPTLPRLRLALWAVPISTRVIGDGLMSAGATPIEMPAERGRATARDRPEHGSLLRTSPRMLLNEGVALRVEDVGPLHGRPAHGMLGFRFRRDRGRTTGAGTVSCSRGFGAACRWRRERWR
jgi:hypothetical protein